MNKRKIIIIVFIISIISITTTTIASAFQYYNKEKNLKQEIDILDEELKSLNEQYQETQEELEETTQELQLLQTGNVYKRYDPTYNEMVEFINQDTTDTREYITDEFVCRHFAQVVNNNAEKLGIRCAIVRWDPIEDDGDGHVLIGFSTTDKEIVYVEPQKDDMVENLEIGNEYWTDCVIPKDDSYTYGDSPTDTIKSIYTFW